MVNFFVAFIWIFVAISVHSFPHCFFDIHVTLIFYEMEGNLDLISFLCTGKEEEKKIETFDKMTRLQTHLIFIECVTKENLAIALEKSVHTRCHQFSAAGLDPRQMKTGKTRSWHSKCFAILFGFYWAPTKIWEKKQKLHIISK